MILLHLAFSECGPKVLISTVSQETEMLIARYYKSGVGFVSGKSFSDSRNNSPVGSLMPRGFAKGNHPFARAAEQAWQNISCCAVMKQLLSIKGYILTPCSLVK